MFQLSSRNKVFFPIVIFAIVAILTTVILIIVTKNNNDNNDNKNDNKEVIREKSKYGLSSLTEKYVVNELEYESCSEEEGGIKSIIGLKDKAVQKKLSQLFVNCKYYSGPIIGNTVSIVEYDDDWNTISQMNLRLDTGEEYEFEEIFLAETNMDQMISLAVNYYYACKYAENGSHCAYLYDYEKDYDEQTKKPANFDLEEEIFRTINIYHDEGVKNFYVGTNLIEFQIGDLEMFLPTKKVWEELAIYKRFLTKESLFEKESTLTHYVLSWYRGDKYNGFLLDNLFVEEYNEYVHEGTPSIVKTAILKQNQVVKEKIIEMAKTDKNNVYFLILDGNIYLEDEEDYGNESNIILFKINKKDYERLGGEEYLAAEQRLDRMDSTFYFNDDYAREVDISNLISANFRVLDKNAKVLDNYCKIGSFWEKIGTNIEVWDDKTDKYRDYFLEEGCKLTPIN